MTNSVDPDQTAPSGQSDLGLHYLDMLFCQKLWCTKFQDIDRESFYKELFIFSVFSLLHGDLAAEKMGTAYSPTISTWSCGNILAYLRI